MKIFKFLIGTLISAFFIYLAFKDIRFVELWQSILDSNWLWLIPAIAAHILSYWIRAVRWRYLLSDVKDVKLSNLYSAVMVGYMALNIFPLRLGEFFRAYVIGKTENISRTTSFATIVVERIVDILTLLLLLIGAIVLNPHLAEREFLGRTLSSSGTIILVGTLLVLAGLLFPLFARETAKKIAMIFLNKLPENLTEKLMGILRSFWIGIASLQKTEQFIPIIVSSLVMWFCFIANLYFTIYTFGIEDKIGELFPATLVIIVVGGISVMIPAGPGSVGTLDAAYKEILIFLSNGAILPNLALGFALVNHYITQFIPINIIGFYYFWKEKLSFSRIQTEGDS